MMCLDLLSVYMKGSRASDGDVGRAWNRGMVFLV